MGRRVVPSRMPARRKILNKFGRPSLSQADAPLRWRPPCPAGSFPAGLHFLPKELSTPERPEG